MRLKRPTFLVVLMLMTLVAPALAQAQAAEDADGLTPAFKEGDVVTFDQIEKLKPFLPEEFWDNRDFFFYEGMQLEIGPTQFDYSTPKCRSLDATEKFAGQAKIGPTTASRTGPPVIPSREEIDCKGDPQAGVKIMWDFDGECAATAVTHRSSTPTGTAASSCPSTTRAPDRRSLAVAPGRAEYLDKNGGDIFRGEKRKFAFGVDVTAPFDARGIQLLSYRYKSSDKPRKDATQRRHLGLRSDPAPRAPDLDRTADRRHLGHRLHLRRPAQLQRHHSAVRVECLARCKIIAPTNTKVKAYPYEKDHNFGPYGLSYADDRWELRDAWVKSG